MFREFERTTEALGSRSLGRGAMPGAGAASRIRAVMQIVLTALLVPLCLWALFGRGAEPGPARDAASALLGAILAFWLKD